MKKIELFRMLLTVCLILLVASGAVFAAVKVKADGLLTSVESDGTIVIIKDHKGQLNGYLLSPSATVQDYQGKRILLKEIPLPYNVYFEYEYSPRGFMIILIKEIPG